MALIEQAKCIITQVNHKGLGIGHTEYGKIEMPYVLEGEEIEFQRHHYRGQTDFVLINILRSSSSRKTPVCEYFGRCGGCAAQHMNDEYYKNFKFNLISQPLKKLSKNVKLNPILTIPFGSRRKIILHAIKKHDNIHLGYYRWRSHNIINIEHCPAALTEISNLIIPLKILLQLILENRQKCQVYITSADNGLIISIETDIKSKDFETELQKFGIKHNLLQIAIKISDQIITIYEQSKPKVFFNHIGVEIDSFSFLQATKFTDKILPDLIRKFLPRHGKILELFCGRGTITLPLAENFYLEAYESDQKAINAFKESLEQAKLKEKVKLNLRDLFQFPLKTNELTNFDCCILNPPRQGAEAQTNQLACSAIKNIIYISCNPETFIRDSLILIEAGYKLIEVTPIDQFYFNIHLEIIGHFIKTI